MGFRTSRVRTLKLYEIYGFVIFVCEKLLDGGGATCRDREEEKEWLNGKERESTEKYWTS